MATIPGGCGRLVWQLPDPPASGWDGITFPLTVLAAPDEEGWLFAQQFAFLDGTVGYCGIRPLPGGRQEAVCCIDDAVRSVPMPQAHGRLYRFTVARRVRDDRSWDGALFDTVAGLRHQVGTWVLDDERGLDSSHTGFVEYTRPLASCPDLPLAEIVFGPPAGTDGALGQCLRPAPYGRCRGEFDYQAVAEPGGSVRMRLGRARRDPGPAGRPPLRVTVTVDVGPVR